MGIDFEEIKSNIRKGNFRLIGSGTGRNVYDLGNGYVVKIAKNKRGFIQNESEIRIATIDHSHVFAKVLSSSDEYDYLIMEKAERINSISEVWKYYHVTNNRELFRLEEFKNLTKDYNLLLGDLRRANSWGLVKGKPVIIDFGFTRDVSKYYRMF